MRNSVLLLCLVSVSISHIFSQSASQDFGLVALCSINFHPDKAGFVRMVNDISEAEYAHQSSLTKPKEHHAYYEYDPILSYSAQGGRRTNREIDGRFSPGVVFESCAKPWIGATFYMKCADAIEVTPIWRFDIEDVAYEVSFPTQIITPIGLVSIAGNEYIARYEYREATNSIPAGYTLAYEEATIEFRIKSVEPPGPVSPGGYNGVLIGGCDIYVLADEPFGNSPNITRYGHVLRNRYSSIRNGCAYGHGTSNYDGWLQKMFDGYFTPRNVAVRGKDGIKLEYWDRDDPACQTLSGLFSTGDGKCGIFSAYLSEMIAVQGYPYVQNQEQVLWASGLNNFSQGRLDFNFFDEDLINHALRLRFGRSNYRWTYFQDDPVFAVIRDVGLLAGRANKIIPAGAQYPKNYDIVPPLGVSQRAMVVAGQNNSVPRHIFSNHVVHLVDTFLYDPSYGLKLPHFLYPNNTGLHGVNFEENEGISLTRSALVTVNISTLLSIRREHFIVPLELNNNQELDLNIINP